MIQTTFSMCSRCGTLGSDENELMDNSYTKKRFGIFKRRYIDFKCERCMSLSKPETIVVDPMVILFEKYNEILEEESKMNNEPNYKHTVYGEDKSDGWLTTGKMIDVLQDDEQAKSDCGKWIARWKDDSILLTHIVNEGGRRHISTNDLKRKWRILPNYSSFLGAMEAIKKGEKVRFYASDGCLIDMTGRYSLQWLSKYSWDELINGKWSVVK